MRPVRQERRYVDTGGVTGLWAEGTAPPPPALSKLFLSSRALITGHKGSHNSIINDNQYKIQRLLSKGHPRVLSYGPHWPNKSTGYQTFGCCFVKNLPGYTWCACGIWMISYPVYHSIDLQWDVFPFLTLPPSFMFLPPFPPFPSPSPSPLRTFFQAGKVLHNSLISRSKLYGGV